MYQDYEINNEVQLDFKDNQLAEKVFKKGEFDIMDTEIQIKQSKSSNTFLG